ncbi:hypothetical protein JNW89_09795 [Micromonospora sp. 4G55]|nr:hypothetical protein [Micromonospora sp. 4G55]
MPGQIRGVAAGRRGSGFCGWSATGSPFEPVPDAQAVVYGGLVLPRPDRCALPQRITPGGASISSRDEARELARTDRDAGVLAIRDGGLPLPYPELDDEPDLPRLARAGRHVAPPEVYLRDIGVEVGAAEVAATVMAQAAAGNGWVAVVGGLQLLNRSADKKMMKQMRALQGTAQVVAGARRARRRRTSARARRVAAGPRRRHPAPVGSAGWRSVPPPGARHRSGDRFGGR